MVSKLHTMFKIAFSLWRELTGIFSYMVTDALVEGLDLWGSEVRRQGLMG